MLPPDFITYTKIGFRKNGRIYTLTLNNDIALPPPDSICSIGLNEVTDDTTIVGGYYFSPHYRYGAYLDTLYSVGGGFNCAYYRVDMENRVIIFDGEIPNDEIILEYKSSGVKAGGALIPRQAVPTLKAYLHWKTIEYSNSYGNGDKDRKEKQYYSERRKLAFLENSFSGYELMDVLWSTYSQSPKR